MKRRIITEEKINQFKQYLRNEERSENTIEKYLRDVHFFFSFVDKEAITKDIVISYKNQLIQKGYAVHTINSMLASIHSFFSFLDWNELKVKSIKCQRQIYYPEEKELTKEEYVRLVNVAKRQGKERLSLLIQTIGATGIRVSELPYITVESIQCGEITVSLKGKIRKIFLVEELRKKLLNYAKRKGIKTGSIFITRTGKNLNRSNIWKEIKKLCVESNINPEKGFPHNLRHLFARLFYKIEKDIAKLADILGHSSINTTRIYIMSTGKEHKRQIESMKLIL